MKTMARKQQIGEALSKASESFTDDEIEIMERYKLDPDVKSWTMMPIYEAGGRRDISAREMAIMEALCERLNINLVVLQPYKKDIS